MPLFIPRNPRQPSPLALCTQVLHKFSVELPKKHGRGGQSALRFARLRLEKRHNYVRKVAEAATQIFVPGGDRPNVAGLVLAGSAEFKNELSESDLFDPRLKAIVLAVVDVSYGKRNEGEKRKKGGKKKKKDEGEVFFFFGKLINSNNDENCRKEASVFSELSKQAKKEKLRELADSSGYEMNN